MAGHREPGRTSCLFSPFQLSLNSDLSEDGLLI
jgi:hypothetical protein